MHTRLAHLVARDALGLERRARPDHGGAVSPSLVLEIERLLRRGEDGEHHVLPRVHRLAFDGEHEIARLEARLLGRRSRLDHAHHRRHLTRVARREPGHEHDRHQDDGEDDVGGRAGEEDQDPLPTRPVEVLAGVVAALAGVLPREVDVAAQRNPRHPVLGLAAAKREQLAPEAEREGEHPDAEALGHQVVAELVDEDDDAEREEEGERVAEELHGGVGAEDGACSERGLLPRPPHATLWRRERRGARPLRMRRSQSEAARPEASSKP